jgi:hypothetical protein
MNHFNMFNEDVANVYWLPPCKICGKPSYHRDFGSGKREDAIVLCDKHYESELRKQKIIQLNVSTTF